MHATLTRFYDRLRSLSHEKRSAVSDELRGVDAPGEAARAPSGGDGQSSDEARAAATRRPGELTSWSPGQSPGASAAGSFSLADSKDGAGGEPLAKGEGAREAAVSWASL